MQLKEWAPLYQKIIEEFGYDESSDENSARLLKALMMNSNLVTEDEIHIQKTVTIFGNSGSLKKDISQMKPRGTLIASGSSVEKLMEMNILPDIVVTDLDGEIRQQIEASKKGALTFIHAHGDNTQLIQRYAQEFTGPVVLTTQSRPDNLISNYGGFTDGDRAVCIARHFGAKEILLLGFDFNEPSSKDGSDSIIKSKKLRWAEKIIFDHNEPGVKIIMP